MNITFLAPVFLPNYGGAVYEEEKLLIGSI